MGKLLVVDDDPQFLSEIDARLTQLGYVVLPSATPGAALAVSRACRDEIDIAVIDLDLGDRSGLDLIMKLRQIAPQVKIVAISGVLQSEVLEIARYFGAAETLKKPLDDRGWATIQAMKQRSSDQVASNHTIL